MRYAYRVVDVFTERRFEGNPLAVLPHADGLDGAMMQRIAREFNLSETVFVLPAERGGAARLRIFTPGQELRFAGHPTIGAGHVLRTSGVASGDRFTVEEPVGDVPLRADGALLWLTTPPVTFGGTVDAAACARALRVAGGDLLGPPPQVASAGSSFLYVALASRDAVDRAALDAAALPPGSGDVGVFVFCPQHRVGELPAVYARMFAPNVGIVEDPATGSATGPLAAYLMKHALLPPEALRRFVSEQGTKMGRRSVLHVAVSGSPDAPVIEVGGSTVDVAEGMLEAP